jgi:hypothetical protein
LLLACICSFEIFNIDKEILRLEDNPKLSRRSIMKGAALLVGGTLIAGVMANKRSACAESLKIKSGA